MHFTGTKLSHEMLVLIAEPKLHVCSVARTFTSCIHKNMDVNVDKEQILDM